MFVGFLIIFVLFKAELSIWMVRVEEIKRILRGKSKQVTEYSKRLLSSLHVFYELFLCFKPGLISLMCGSGQCPG